MKVAFRVDSSTCMGTGHLTRCLTLAETLRERDVETRFICREHPGHLIALLHQRAMPVTLLPASKPEDTPHGTGYSSWLGATPSTDAEQTIAALQDERPDWLVVDHYGIDLAWEQHLRPRVAQLMAIDDLANRDHDCDVLLDQNYSSEGERRYSGRVPAGCRCLIGPRYALLRPEYAAYRQTSQVRSTRRVENVLVFFGADSQNATELALEALSLPEFRHLTVDLVFGSEVPRRETLEALVASRPLTTLHGLRPQLADLMAKADLAIGGCGATTWERMCLGLPSIVVSMAENQQPASEALAVAGLIHYVGDVTSLRSAQLADALREMIAAPHRLSALSASNGFLVDGLGALRVAEVMEPTPADQLAMRPASQGDIELYFNWANDPEVRRQATCSAPIAWSRHQEWFADKLADRCSQLFVLLAGALPVGQIRYDRKGDQAQIDYSLDVLVRGRGWGVSLVSMGNALVQASGPIQLRAEVKAGNQASRSVFVRLGFEQASSTQAGEEYIHFTRDPVRCVGQGSDSVANVLTAIHAAGQVDA